MKFKSTGWEITGASGVTATVETPIINLGISASYIRLPIRDTKSPKKKPIMLTGIGGGGDFGVSLASPGASVSGSLDAFPADGIGQIVKGTSPLNRPYKASDFSGDILVFGVNGGIQISGQLSGVLWLTEPAVNCVKRLNCSSTRLITIARQTLMLTIGMSVPSVTIPMIAHDLYKSTKAAGCFAATNITTQLAGIGVNVYKYTVKP